MLSKKKRLPYFLKPTLVNLAIARKGLLKFDNHNISDLFTSMIISFQIPLCYTLVSQKRNERSERMKDE